MAIDFGTDVSTYKNGDVDPYFGLIAGYRVIAEAVARRLETPRGSLPGDPNYGSDVRVFLNRDFDASPAALFVVRSTIEQEAEKEERVESCSASVTFDFARNRLRTVITLEAGDGPFELVLDVSAVSVALLSPK